MLKCLAAAAFTAAALGGPAVPLQAAEPVVLPDGSIYEGPQRDGLFHGRGILRWPNGDEYEGDFRNGLFHGRGERRYADGDRYVGQFVNGREHGRGRYETADGDVYEGSFVGGEFTGRGSLTDADGTRYEGEFKDWRFEGHGTYYWPDGDRYVGEFRDGYFHGEGTVYYREPKGGAKTLHGRWDQGDFVDEGAGHAAGGEITEVLDAELLLYEQPARLEQALGQLAPGQRGRIDLYLLSFAGDGEQDVFMKEAIRANDVLSSYFDEHGHSLELINNRQTLQNLPLATRTNLRVALRQLGRLMNAEEDILVLFVTSHGTEDHEIVVQLGNLPLVNLDAADLAAMLEASGIKWKVIILSACYSGGFIDELMDDSTLIMTAANAERVSFGCSDEAELTYFGEGFLERALPDSDSLLEAFEKTKSVVAKMEEEAGFGHSEPQIAKAPAIVEQLRRRGAQQAAFSARR